MAKKRMTRKRAIRRRNAFIALIAVLIAIIIGIIAFVTLSSDSGKPDDTSAKGSSSATTSDKTEETKEDESSSVTESSSTQSVSSQSEPQSNSSVSESSSDVSSSSKDSSITESSSAVSKPKPVKKLDSNFTDLLLVNGKNPLPKNYDYEGNLKTIPNKYICGYRNQCNADVYPYAIAMVEAAWADGVDLYILSPYRSYDSQVTLYNNEVAKWKSKGMSQKKAEEKAATVVARPGTSEHHTGMAIDFNSVEPSFESTPMYKWLDKHAQDYGFILRYPKSKEAITGVIHEAWHWRFVGINKAKEIKASGLCLEEYLGQTG